MLMLAHFVRLLLCVFQLLIVLINRANDELAPYKRLPALPSFSSLAARNEYLVYDASFLLLLFHFSS